MGDALTCFKKWITGVLSATHMTTAVRTGGPGAKGVSVLVIPTNSPGFSARKIQNSGANAGGTRNSNEMVKD
jgi:alkylation response protein AidB-like acyl-CoA dehydrogenase